MKRQSDEPAVAVNVRIGKSGKERDRRVHIVRERDGAFITAYCGSEFQAEEEHMYDEYDGAMEENGKKDRCARCFPEESAFGSRV